MSGALALTRSNRQILDSSYPALRDHVRRTLLLGQQRIEQEKVRTYWETGQLIQTYLIRHYKDRAEHYGQQVVLKLAEDLNISLSLLRRCIRFAETFKIGAARHQSFPGQLSWAHFRALLAIQDEKTRLKLTDRAERQEWTSRELEIEVKKFNARALEEKNGSPKLFEPLQPLKGDFYTYRLIRPEKIHPGKSELRIDLGFSDYKEASMKGAENLKAGDIATSVWVEGDIYRLEKAAGKTEADLFTYYAYIERVVDGDTLFVQVDLGFGWITRQYLRLRGIDAPELDTAEGRRAKKFVESELASVPYVTISSTRSDKYDRYLADIFYQSKSGEQFLNNRLLESRLAWRV